MKIHPKIIFIGITFLTLFNCSTPSNTQNKTKERVSFQPEKQLKTYWYEGKGEINTYELKQFRYGEQHEGKAVLVYATEPFLPNEQVKDEANDYKYNVNVLKCNFTKKFITGVYPYSIMMSVFTPFESEEFPYTYKVSMSSQEWCGHMWTQLNKKGNRYLERTHSYFEKEADFRKSIPMYFLEDEIWTRIRINPYGMPTGSFKMIRSTVQSRLNHLPVEPVQVKASLDTSDAEVILYSVLFTATERKLSVKVEKKAPHKIVYWKEQYEGAEKFSEATFLSSVKMKYWNKNQPKDTVLQKETRFP